MEKLKTYFEQIPVELVKKIAHQNPASDDVREQGSDADPSQDGWRGVAKRVIAERDPNKMVELVQELVKKYDEERSPIGQPIRDAE